MLHLFLSATTETAVDTSVSIPQLFMQGGPVGMSILTALLVALLFAAWKAPAWVKEIGAAGLAFSLFMIAISWYKAATAVEICKGAQTPQVEDGQL